MRRLTPQARKLLLNAGLCLLSLVGCSGAMELCLRFGIIKNSRHDLLRVEGKRRGAGRHLLILGDSFIVKRGALGESLTRQLGGDSAVLNLAVAGHGPLQYLRAMASTGVKFAPDAVVLAYYVGNDLTNVQYQLADQPQTWAGSVASWAARGLKALAKTTYIYHFVVAAVAPWLSSGFDFERMAAAGMPPDLIEEAKRGQVSPWLLQLALLKKRYVLDNVMMETPENKAAWDVVRAQLAEVQAACKSVEAKLLIVAFPHSVQVNASHFEFFERLGYDTDRRSLDAARPQELLAGFCRERGIPWLDLLPAYRARKGEEFYAPKDDHFNDDGSRLAADLIVEFISENAE